MYEKNCCVRKNQNMNQLFLSYWRQILKCIEIYIEKKIKKT